VRPEAIGIARFLEITPQAAEAARYLVDLLLED
jgi:hypothetical protein